MKRHVANVELIKSLPVISMTVPPRIGPNAGDGTFLTRTGTMSDTVAAISLKGTLYSVPTVVRKFVLMELLMVPIKFMLAVTEAEVLCGVSTEYSTTTPSFNPCNLLLRRLASARSATEIISTAEADTPRAVEMALIIFVLPASAFTVAKSSLVKLRVCFMLT